MGIQAAQLYALVSVAGASQSVSELQRVGNAVNTAQGKMGGLGANARQMATGVKQVAGGLVRVAEIAAVAIGGTVAASAKVASTFQAEMELIHTQAGALQTEVDSQTKAVLALAHSVGTAPEELAKGLYHIESVGLRGAKALEVLRAGALGAKTGLASMEETTNALTAVAFSGISGVNNMTDAMGALDGIVGVANVRLGDFVESLGTGILGTSKTFGVSLQSMGAAFAVLSDAGVKASPAMTRMQMMFTHMAAPTAAALKIFKKLGLDQFALAEDLRKPDGIFVALDDLRTHLEKTGEMVNGVLTPQGTADIAKMFGGSRFGAAAMQLLQMADRIPQKFAAINVQQQQFGQRIQATMETTRFKWGQFLGDLQTAAIKFGTAINPALARGLGHIDDFLVAHFGDIEQAGRDLGAAIDKIDWTKVEDGAKSFVDVLRTAFGLISKIPVEIDAMVAGFLGLNKLSGGLLGAGIGNIAGGLAKGIAGILGSVLGKIPGIGGAVNAVSDATAMRVHVTNWPAGFGGGIPGGPGVTGAASGLGAALGEAGLTLSLGTAAGLAITAAVEVGLAELVRRALHPTTSGDLIQSFTPDEAARYHTGTSVEDILAARNTASPFDTDKTLPTLEAIQSAILGGDRWWADTAFNTGETARAAKIANVKPAWLTKWEALFKQPLHLDMKKAVANLSSGTNVGSSAMYLAQHLGTGIGTGGNVAAEAFETAIKNALVTTTDPATRRQLTEALHVIERKLPGLEANNQALHKADQIAASSKSTAEKVKEIHALEANVGSTTKAKLEALIHAVRTHKSRVVINPGSAILRETLYNPATNAAQVKVALATGKTTTRIDLASGAVGIAKSPTMALFGEAGHEGVAIIRNPRPFDPAALGGGVRVDVRPQPVSLRINGREIVHAMLLSNAFVRGAETV